MNISSLFFLNYISHGLIFKIAGCRGLPSREYYRPDYPEVRGILAMRLDHYAHYLFLLQAVGILIIMVCGVLVCSSGTHVIHHFFPNVIVHGFVSHVT